jgi:hypothetical protein
LRYETPVLDPSKSDDPYGKMLLRRRSPYTSITLVTFAFATVVLPFVAASADTDREWISVLVAGSPFPLLFAYSVAIRLEIFERVIRVRKLWGTRVIPLSQLQSFKIESNSNIRARVVFIPREGPSLHVTVESSKDDDELQAVLDGVTRPGAAIPA